MTPEKIHTDAFCVVGPGGEFSHENMAGIAALWEELIRRAGEVVPDAAPESLPAAFGAMSGAPDKFLYVAGFSAAAGSAPEGMRALEVPAGNYAKFAHQAAGEDGFQDSLRQTFERISREWMPASGLKMRWPAPVLERYGEKFDPRTMTGELEIWMPVE